MSKDETARPGGLHRREFFREGLRNLFQSMARAVEERLEAIRLPPGAGSGAGGWGSPEPHADPALENRILRPPGALKEELFVERCERSGECVRACPVQAIRPYQTEDGTLTGTPHIQPDLQACVVCDGLHCMHACPSGALSPLPRNRIAMGLAEVRHDTCVRSRGEECQLCVDRCPIGRAAIDIPYYGARVEVKADGCVGCGVCEMVCPTTPKAVVIRPR